MSTTVSAKAPLNRDCRFLSTNYLPRLCSPYRDPQCRHRHIPSFDPTSSPLDRQHRHETQTASHGPLLRCRLRHDRRYHSSRDNYERTSYIKTHTAGQKSNTNYRTAPTAPSQAPSGPAVRPLCQSSSPISPSSNPSSAEASRRSVSPSSSVLLARTPSRTHSPPAEVCRP